MPGGQLTTPDGAPRVVVTGTGMLTALGADVASTWAGLIAGRSGIATITAFDPARVSSRIAGEVPGFDRGLDETVFMERLGRTDARVICCGHTHVP